MVFYVLFPCLGKIEKQCTFLSRPHNWLPRVKATFDTQLLKIKLTVPSRFSRKLVARWTRASNVLKQLISQRDEEMFLWLKWQKWGSGDSKDGIFHPAASYSCSVFPSERKWHVASRISSQPFQSFLTFIFVKQIALNMSKPLELSVSQILKIKMIHKDSTCVCRLQDKISRKQKPQPWLFRA